MIRLSGLDEAKSILLEPQIVDRVGLMVEQFKFQPWIAYNRGHRLLFVFWEKSNGVYEMHIAAPKDSILSCRSLAKEAMSWVFSMGAKKIVTNCPKGKISNMAKKIGLKLSVSENGQDYYEAESWL